MCVCSCGNQYLKYGTNILSIPKSSAFNLTQCVSSFISLHMTYLVFWIKHLSNILFNQNEYFQCMQHLHDRMLVITNSAHNIFIYLYCLDKMTNRKREHIDWVRIETSLENVIQSFILNLNSVQSDREKLTFFFIKGHFCISIAYIDFTFRRLYIAM